MSFFRSGHRSVQNCRLLPQRRTLREAAGGGAEGQPRILGGAGRGASETGFRIAAWRGSAPAAVQRGRPSGRLGDCAGGCGEPGGPGEQCCGSMTFWCGSGSGSAMPLTNVSGSCYFRHWPSRCQRKTSFLTQFFLLITFRRYVHLNHFKNKKSRRVTK